MHPHIEQYLNQVERQLKGSTSEQREAELREIEQHIQFLAEEGQQQGLSYPEAVKLALRQFGKPQKVGRELHLSLRSNSQREYFVPFVIATLLAKPTIAVLFYGISFFFSPTYLIWDITSASSLLPFPMLIAAWIFYILVTSVTASLFRQRRPLAFYFLSLILITQILANTSDFSSSLQTIQIVVAHPRDVIQWPVCFRVALLFGCNFPWPTLGLLLLWQNRTTYFSQAQRRWNI